LTTEALIVVLEFWRSDLRELGAPVGRQPTAAITTRYTAIRILPPLDGTFTEVYADVTPLVRRPSR
jgi:hypothetical protein